LLKTGIQCTDCPHLETHRQAKNSRISNSGPPEPAALRARRLAAGSGVSPGIESIEQFARREPLRRVHECVFGVLALESEPVDPGL
jgi:protein phosphatase